MARRDTKLFQVRVDAVAADRLNDLRRRYKEGVGADNDDALVPVLEGALREAADSVSASAEASEHVRHIREALEVIRTETDALAALEASAEARAEARVSMAERSRSRRLADGAGD